MPWAGRITKTARVRAEAAMSSPVVGELAAAEAVQVIQSGRCSKSGVDRLLVVGSLQGWVSRKMVAADEDSVEVISSDRPGRLWVLSDVHTDRATNVNWLQRHLPSCRDGSHFDVLLCAGDVSASISRLRETLELLAKRFDLVAFTPGNHDGWVTASERGKTTFDKLEQVRQVCQDLGVRLGPLQVGGVLVVPLYSWYEAAFDDEPDIEAGDTAELRCRWIDYTLCRWGAALESADGFSFGADGGTSGHVAEYFAERNEVRIANVENELSSYQDERPVVVTMSHFAPRLELLPEKRFLIDPHIPKVSGSRRIETQLRRLGAAVHVFGHTHLAMDLDVEGVRYVNWPLGSGREQQHQTRVVAGSGALLLYDDDRGFTPTQWTFWSDWYRRTKREPASNRLAPWVLKAYAALGLKHTPGFVKEDDNTKLPSFPDNMAADHFYKLNAYKERHFRSAHDADDLRQD